MKNPADRWRGGVAIISILCAGLLVGPALATAKPRRADLTVGPVTLSGAPAAGAKVKLRVSVRNAGTATAKATQLAVSLEKTPLARASVGKLKAGQRKVVTVSVSLPRPAAPGRYRISVCADAARKVKERSETNNCRTLPQVLEVSAPAAVLPAPGGAPATVTPGPVASVTATATATTTVTATPTPTPTPTATATPAGEVPPEDLPPLIPAFADTAQQLYAAQGVAAGAIAETRAAILRGRTLQRNGNPLAGVRVRVHDHPELGSATSAADGTYELAVNGGAQLTLEYTRAGHLELQRDIDPTQLEWTNPSDVVLLAADPVGMVLDPPAAGVWTAARATAQTDLDGTRTSTLLFAPGTTATMHFSDGSTRPLPGPWTVRQTEYTSVGPAAMPGDLPPTSGYTYAAELAIDEAVTAGADSVELKSAGDLAPPAVNYVENFIGAPVGTDVPTGAYDRTDAVWEPAPDGRVVKVISETGGMAHLDTDGDGDSDAQDYPPALKLTTAERVALVPLYAPGDELFRVPIPHLTPWDHNWPFGFPQGARPPRLGPDGRPLPDLCQQGGSSTIGCEDQTLGEAVHVPGTPYRLSYSSGWDAGAGESREFDVPVTEATLPPGLIGVELEVDIAGQRITRRHADPAAFGAGTGIPPITPGIVEHVEWNGLDWLGKPVVGSVAARLTLNYYYEAVYYASSDDLDASFAQVADGANPDAFPSRPGCSNVAAFGGSAAGDLCAFKFTAKETRALGAMGRSQTGLGGWDLDAHHLYDAIAGEVRLGDGTIRRGGELELGRLRTVAGPGADGSTAALIGIDVLAVLADGSVLHGGGNQINRTPPGAASVPFAGNGSSVSTGVCDGGPVLGRSIQSTTSVAVRPDGGVVLAIATANQGGRICVVTPDGKLALIGGAAMTECPAGNDCRGDGGQAKDAPIQRPSELTIAPDGSIYFLEVEGPTNGNRKRIRRIDPTGIISTVAGGGDANPPAADPDGVPADGYALRDVRSLLAMPDGTLLIADTTAGIVIELGTDGVLRRYAGSFAQTVSYTLDVDRRAAQLGHPYALALGRDGSVFALVEADSINSIRRRIVRIRPDGVVVRAVGFGAQTPCPPTPTELESALDRCGLGAGALLAVDGAGRLLFADGNPARVRRLEPVLAAAAPGAKAIPSADGSKVWLFDASGRHLRTVDGLTGTTLTEFGYDAAGRLVRAEDADGLKTLIERDAAGAPKAIVAPDGRRTTLGLNAAGKLSAITDPMGSARGLSYDAGGRLNGQHLPSGRESSYVYDGDGRLISATGAAGQTRLLARTQLSAVARAVDVTTGEGRVTRYTVESTAGGGVLRTVRAPSGALTSLAVASDGTRTLTLPSGETRRTTSTSDKRFGAAVSRVRSQTTTAPSGKSVTVNFAYGATLATPGQPFDPAQLTTDVTGPLGLTRSIYTGATRTFKTTTPAGRQTTTTYDARGRAVAQQAGDPGILAPVTVEYGAQGQITRIAQGTHATRYEHDAAGRLSAIVTADGQRLEYAYDAADRLTERRYPDGRTYRYGHDADGELISRTLPSARAHGFTPTGLAGQTSAWTPPGAAGSYSVTRDGDELATSVTSPGGAVRAITGDAAGRVTGFSGRTATYAPGVDRIAKYESTTAPASAVQTLSPAFDGMRVSKLTAEGVAPAETTWAYDADLRPTSARLVSGSDDTTLAYPRDADGVLSGTGPFTYERNGPDRSLSAITDQTGRTEETVDAVADLKTRRLLVGGVEKYRLELTTDATGRITARHEVAGGGDHTYAYAYDTNGELTEVRRDGTLVETYAYDLDGDRTSQGATYDAGGKLTSRGGTSYAFDADGFLATRGAEAFTYARSGELRSAGAVSYASDALGRRVARIDAAGTTQYVYADPDSPYRVSAARAPNGTLDRYLYGPRGNLYAILRAGVRFHVATDQVGSPRVVVAADGTVVKRLEYDAYGVTTDLDPAFFFPFGYAGGLRDAATGLIRFGLRDYEPQSGRFTARDPATFAGSPRSLYGYANNSPVTYHDPGGTASISFGGYLGPGGGTTIYFDPKAFLDRDRPLITGLCAEFGLGLGGGIESDLMEAAPTEGSLAAFAELTPKVPFLGGKFGGEFDLICGGGKLKGGANAGPYQFSIDSAGAWSEGGAVDPSADHWADALIGAAEAKLEGKAGFKACLPPPPG